MHQNNFTNSKVTSNSNRIAVSAVKHYGDRNNQVRNIVIRNND